MYNVINRFAISKEVNHGLMLIDMPTGSGKTYNAVKYIFDASMLAENKDKKFLFITTLKKNLPIEDLKKLFENSEKTNLFYDKVLFINSNIDSVIEGWTDTIKKDIPLSIQKLDEFSQLDDDIKFYKYIKDKKEHDCKIFLQNFEQKLREKTEPTFRHKISEILEKRFNTVEDKLYAVKTNKDWQWLGKLYPAIFTRDKQILLMSADKFLSMNSTIVEPSYYFYDSSLTDNALIFIDEFDAVKETILKNIINNGIHYKIQYIELFKNIYNYLKNDTYPSILTTPSKAFSSSTYNKKTLECILSNFKKIAYNICDKYNLQFSLRTLDEEDDIHSNYLFHDYGFHYVLNSKSSKSITIKNNLKTNINEIIFEKNTIASSNDTTRIHSMLGQIYGFLKYFVKGIKILAINYAKLKNENRKEGQDLFSTESAVRTILTIFGLSGNNIDYLTEQIMMSHSLNKPTTYKSLYDLSFYEQGFCYYDFDNHLDHDLNTVITMYSFQNTPEKFLVKLCEKAKVVGISATATIPSVVGNFDISYLKDKLKKSFVLLTEEERARLSSNYNKNQKGYANINIQSKLLGNQGIYSNTAWELVFDNKENAQKVANDLNNELLFIDTNNFIKERYLRISLAYRQFIEHDDIYSFLCVLTKHPQKGDQSLDRDKLDEIFRLINQELGQSYEEDSIFYLDGTDYENKKTILLEKLSEGKKIFVISVYQTIGAGQNLQYSVPDKLKAKLVRSNDFSEQNEKDFDAIYLEKPTNLIVNKNDVLDEHNFIKYIFQMEFLRQNAELSISSANANIKHAFKIFGSQNKPCTKPDYKPSSRGNVYELQSVILMSTRYIIQAIGRICRTNIKNKNIYIYADSRIADCLDLTVADHRIFNPEFMNFLDTIKQTATTTPNDKITRLRNKATANATLAFLFIKRLLNNEWTEDNIQIWKDMRNKVLAKPTASIEDADNDEFIKNFYATLPTKGNTLFFNQESDYNQIDISFIQDQKHKYVLSEHSTKLQDMLKISGVKELFVQNGWACHFAENDYIMTPPLWNNIYKGALGEVVGRHIFSSYLGVELEEIEDQTIFELFDFKVRGQSVYIDFKNWHEGETTDRTKMEEKIASKANECGGRCAIIANIIAEQTWPISDTIMNNVRIISIPSLFIKNKNSISLNNEAFTVIKDVLNEFKN